MPAISPYAEYCRPLVADLQQAFSNQIGRTLPIFDLDNAIAGEQFGILTFESFRLSRDRRGAKALGSKFVDLQFLVMVAKTIDCSGLPESEIEQEVEIVALEQVFNLDHGIHLMLEDVTTSYGMVFGIEFNGDIDRAVSQPLQEREFRVITVTATITVNVAISVSERGAHLPVSGSV